MAHGRHVDDRICALGREKLRASYDARSTPQMILAATHSRLQYVLTGEVSTQRRQVGTKRSRALLRSSFHIHSQTSLCKVRSSAVCVRASMSARGQRQTFGPRGCVGRADKRT
eukprot:3807386-Pleurochrysis_carterae.AAC.1